MLSSKLNKCMLSKHNTHREYLKIRDIIVEGIILERGENLHREKKLHEITILGNNIVFGIEMEEVLHEVIIDYSGYIYWRHSWIWQDMSKERMNKFVPKFHQGNANDNL